MGISLFIETTEVIHADFLPFLGIIQLMLQSCVNLLPSLFVDVGLGLVPCLDKVLNLVYTTCVVEVHLLKHSASALHTIAPWHTMEPQQISLRACVDVIIHLAVWLAILGCSV